jgi:hypothetical protein
MEEKKQHRIVEAGKATQFSSNNQPDTRGRKKGKTVSDWLRELGEKQSIHYKITTTGEDGKQKVQEGKMESETTLNELLAIKLLTKAISGDHRFIETILDRTEGKANQKLSLASDPDDQLPQIAIIKLPDNNRD